MRRLRIMLGTGLAICLALLVASGAASGAVTAITVTTLSDGAGTGDCLSTDISCTLRQAIDAADDQSGTTINIPAGTFLLQDGHLSVTAPMTLLGRSASTTLIDGNHNGQVFDVSSVGFLTADDLTIQNANGSADGAGLEVGPDASATLNDDVVTGNTTSENGGGLYASGDLTLDDDLITGNSAIGNDSEGGGLFVTGADGENDTITVENTTISDNQAADGAGIDVDLLDQNSGKTALTVTGSAIISNQAVDDGGGYEGDGSEGTTTASVLMSNTTVADNTVSDADEGGGGGLLVGGLPGSEQFLNDTVADNSAPGGGNVDTGHGTSTFQNTIIAGGTATGGATSGPDCYGPINAIESLGHNLDDGNGCYFSATGDLVNTNPKLGVLQNNGGPTDSLALALNSPAIDAGAGCTATDQRGVARPQGLGCDIGAYESAPPLISGINATGISTTGATIASTVANPDAQNASVSVELGTAAGSYTTTVASQTVAAATAATGYALPVSGLAPGTAYHYEVVVTTPRGPVTSPDQTFTTASIPVTTGGPAPITTTVPSNRFSVSKLRVLRTGKLTAALGAPDAGVFKAKATFSVTRRVIVHKHGKRVIEHKTTTYTYGSATVTARGRGDKALLVSLAAAGEKELAKLGKAKITVAISFTPTGGKAATKKPTITVTRSRRGRYT